MASNERVLSALKSQHQQNVLQDIYGQAADPKPRPQLQISSPGPLSPTRIFTTDERGVPLPHAPRVTNLAEWRATAESTVLPSPIQPTEFLRADRKHVLAAVKTVEPVTHASIPINPKYLPLNSPSKAAATAAMAETLATRTGTAGSTASNNNPKAKGSVVGPKRALHVPKFVATGHDEFDSKARTLRAEHMERLASVGVHFPESLAQTPSSPGFGASASFSPLSPVASGTTSASDNPLLASLSLDGPVAYPVLGGVSSIAASPSHAAAAMAGPPPSVSERIGSLYSPGIRLLSHRLKTNGKSMLPLAQTTVCAALPESHCEWPLMLQFTLDAQLLGKFLAPELIEQAFRGEEEVYNAQVEREKQAKADQEKMAATGRPSTAGIGAGTMSDPFASTRLAGSGLTSADLLSMSMAANLQNTSSSPEQAKRKANRESAKAAEVAKSAELVTPFQLPTDPSTLYKTEKSTLEKLPLEMFDDADEYETHTGAEWVDLGPSSGRGLTTARSLFYLHPHFVWLPCEVLSYDEADQRYLVSFFTEAEMRSNPALQPVFDELLQVLSPVRGPRVQYATDGSVVPPLFDDNVAVLLGERRQKYVKRLSLLFDDEDAGIFFQRLHIAQTQRQAALQQRRLHAFTLTFKAPDLFSPLRTTWIQSIIQRLFTSVESLVMARQPSVDRLLTEVGDEYTHAMRCAVMLYRQLDAQEVRRSRSLRLPPMPQKPAVPARGCHALPRARAPFTETRDAVWRQHFLAAVPAVAVVMLQLQKAWYQLTHTTSAFAPTGSPQVLQRLICSDQRSLGVSDRGLPDSAARQLRLEVEAQRARDANPIAAAAADTARQSAEAEARKRQLVFPMNMYKYADYQEEYFEELHLRLQSEWRDTLVNLVRDNLSQFDLFQRDLEQFASSPLRRLLKLFACHMRQQLSELITVSLDEFVEFFRQFEDPVLPRIVRDVLQEKIDRDRAAVEATEQAERERLAEEAAEEAREAAAEAKRLADEAAELAAEEAEAAQAAATEQTGPDSAPSVMETKPATPEQAQATTSLEGADNMTEAVTAEQSDESVASDAEAETASAAEVRVTEPARVRSLLSHRVREMRRLADAILEAEAAERRRLDRPAPQPLFTVKLVNERGNVSFAPDLDAIEPMFAGLLDLPTKLVDVVQVDNSVVPLLGLPEAPLCTHSLCPHVFEHADSAKARIRSVVEANLVGPRTLAALFSEWSEFLVTRSELLANDWFAGRARLPLGERHVKNLKPFYDVKAPDQHAAYMERLLRQRALDDEQSDDENGVGRDEGEPLVTVQSGIPTQEEIERCDPVVAAERDKAIATAAAAALALRIDAGDDIPPPPLSDAEVAALCTDTRDGQRWEFVRIERSLEDTRAELHRLTNAQRELQDKSPADVAFGLVAVQCASLRDQMANKARRCVRRMLRALVRQIRVRNEYLRARFEAILARIRTPSKDVTELAALKDYLVAVENNDLPTLKRDIRVVEQTVAVVHEFDVTLTKDDSHLWFNVQRYPRQLGDAIKACVESIRTDNVRFEEDLAREQEHFKEDVQAYAKEVQSFVRAGPCTAQQVEELATQVDNLQEKLRVADTKVASFHKREELFNIPTTDYSELDIIRTDFEPYAGLWTTAFLFQSSHQAWLTGNFMDLDGPKMEVSVQQWYTATVKLEKGFRDRIREPHKVCVQLEEKIGEFRKLVPLVRMLRNPGLRPRHWNDIATALSQSSIQPDSLTLQSLLEMNAAYHISHLEEICTAAEKEYQLDSQLDAMLEEWKPMVFEVFPWKATKTYIVRKTDAIMTLLDEQIVKTQTMRGSPYIKPIEGKAKKWEARLQNMTAILEEWLTCQKTWLYLEPIFSSDDIIRQMPTETRRFQSVDQFWRRLMDTAKRTPNLFDLQSEVENLQKNLNSSNEMLDQIMKGLNDYLSAKCLQFPRFFFLSNDELLSILSQTKDPKAVQPHMNKCFEGISLLDFKRDLKIIAMMSAQDERVEFNEVIDPEDGPRKGNVELWLRDVERVMRESLKSILCKSFDAYDEDKRTNWIVSGLWPGQIVLAVAQTMWTFHCEAAINSGGPKALRGYVETMNKQLSKIVDLVRGKLGRMERLTIGALVVIDVHARDVTQKLAEEGLTDVNDFDWLAQLRYYFHEKLLNTRMINAELAYGYEYLGNSDRLVITPLTDRCYRTLMGALHLHLGGAPEGPAGTGKTETVKDLAKAVAKQCVVFNCSDGLTFQSMAKFFKGMAASGAWSCFDEFNRIDLEVLSVIAQQVVTIQIASVEGKQRFMFEGTDLPLDPTNATFITMNPGYAGRSDLPDNLKVLFRSVAMMVPDYALISEISLYSNGYELARPLAQKIVACLRLSSELLSSQDHYDFGMRTVKSILTAAGALKREFVTEQEEVLCLRAINDCNVPKFVSADIPLFTGITRDLFPGVVLPQPDYSVLRAAMIDACAHFKLQPTDIFLEKITQLYETILVRHGLMVVGHTFAGKTSAIRVLAHAMTMLGGGPTGKDIFEDDEMPGAGGESREEQEAKEAAEKKAAEEAAKSKKKKKLTEAEEAEKAAKEKAARDKAALQAQYRRVHVRTINPKSITMGQLYGSFNLMTGEWTDGILAVTIRRCVANMTPDRKWVVFDGPVDAVWIENMNTVLDDNKKLCLANSEIIKLSDPMTMMFEVEDLAVASPATVSRCGMVFMEPRPLGWRPLLSSWLQTLPTSFDKYKDDLRHLFEWAVPPLIVLINKYCKTVLPSTTYVTGMQPVSSMLQLISAQCDDFYVEKFKDSQENAQGIEGAFWFAAIWSLGANLDGPSRVVFNEFIRKMMAGKMEDADPTHLALITDPKALKFKSKTLIPDKGTVYDFRWERSSSGGNRWEHWMDTIAPYKVPDGSMYQNIIVPTIDTVRTASLLGTYITHQRHVLLVGATGTSKTITINTKLTVGLDRNVYQPIPITFSAQTSANQTQDIVDAKLDRRSKGIFGPPLLKRYVVFVDDLNMPVKEKYGAQPPIEIVRQFMDHRGWFDRKLNSFRTLVDVQYVAAMGPPGGGRNSISARLTRHLSVLSILPFDDDSLKRIFMVVLSSWMERGAGAELNALKDPCVTATVEVYGAISRSLLPTPAKSHYLFNLRDLSKVFQGILQADVADVKSGPTFALLWAHEIQRVFADRFVSQDDIDWMTELLSSTVKKYFKMDYEQRVLGTPGRRIVFGDFLDTRAPIKKYRESKDEESLKKVITEKLEEYNAMYPNASMNLVLFRDAVEHVSRIVRVIQQPLGNALLIGVGGSGRQSLTRLASFICEYETVQVEVTKSFTQADWREALVGMLKKAGIEKAKLVFLFTDTQIKYESFVEDINNLLNSGEVPNLFTKEDMGEICERVAADAKKAKNVDSPEGQYAFFVERCRQNLHIVLCLSPIGAALRTRLRMFPSLVNCTTIDWFHPWPKDALRNVALRFLSDIEFTDDERARVVEVCVEMQALVQDLAQRYLSELRRYCYVTPTSYLDLIKTFTTLYNDKRTKVLNDKARYETGLRKLGETAVQVKDMQGELEVLRPKLIQASAETADLMKVIEVRSAAAAITKNQVEEEERICNQQAAEALAIQTNCKFELDQALPLIEEAMSALSVVKKGDLVEVKAMKSPPPLVGVTCQAVCIMFNIQPVKVGEVGKKTDDWWTPSQKSLLSDPGKLLKDLTNYDKDNIDPAIVAKLEPMVAREDFTPAAVEKQSKAVAPLCKFVHAMVKYDVVAKKVKPMQAALAEAEQALASAQEMLAGKKAQLQEVLDMLADLNAQFDEANNKKVALEKDAQQCADRLDRAEKLLGGLAGEKDRWTVSAAQLEKDYHDVLGNVVLSSGVVAYLGVFTSVYRSVALQSWISLLATKNIACSEGYSLEKVIGDPVQIRSWTMQQLPNDAFSVANATIMSKSRSFPLMIDPQGQANKWIKNMEKANNLRVAKLSENNFARALESCIMIGTPMLVENVGEQLDPVLEPILLKQYYKQGAHHMIRMPDGPRDYDLNFRIYITTKLANPHYTPEISTKVCLLNFMITPDGLGDQMLGLTVAKEFPALATELGELVVKNAENQRQLQKLEETILQMLNESKGNILDDEDLLQTLAKSKITSKQIEKKMEESAKTEERINKTREEYRTLSFSAANLFFCVTDLQNIDPMYQYSLVWYLSLYSKSIEAATPDRIISKRAKHIETTFLESLYRNVCRSLFEKDKMLFSLLLCQRIKQFNGQMDNAEWRYLLAGAMLMSDDVVPPNPSDSWLDQVAWEQIVLLSKLPAFEGLSQDVADNIAHWQTYYNSTAPHTATMPGRWDKHLSTFQKLLILRCLRQDFLNQGIYNFIRENMGQFFLDPPPFNIKTSYDDSNPCSPLIFILSPGADPAAELFAYGETIGFSRDKCFSLSLGQGQGVIAENAIREAIDKGTWVILQNCHLSTSWMPTLERIVEEINPATTNENFRLWLTSKPSDSFPVAILQNGVKMTNEPPRGLRANLVRVHQGFDKTWYKGCKQPVAFKKLLFSLCFFHAIIQERRKFGPLGWNIPYEFNESDLNISIKQLRMFLDTYDDVQFKALNYITAQLNYGGRVTDNKDRRCMEKIMAVYYCPGVLKDDYKFSVSGNYFAPPVGELEAIQQYVGNLPRSDPPEVFGLHDNANISSAIRESNLLLTTLLLMQPRETSSGGGLTREQLLANMARDIAQKLPEAFDIEAAQIRFPVVYEESMNTVLVQELIRYNKLSDRVRVALRDLQKALRGEIVMSNELEATGNSMFNGLVPDTWAAVAYPSLKPLGAWVNDLLARLGFFQKWITIGSPSVYWISGFFFTQSFLTGTLQNYARRNRLAIDQISLDFEVCEHIKEPKEGDEPVTLPPEGVYVYGLFVEGAAWDYEKHVLGEALPKQLFSPLPTVWFRPGVTAQITASNATKNLYPCPVYKTSRRAGTLSTTGHSTNFVLSMDLPSLMPETHWVQRGVACLCSLDT